MGLQQIFKNPDGHWPVFSCIRSEIMQKDSYQKISVISILTKLVDDSEDINFKLCHSSSLTDEVSLAYRIIKFTIIWSV